MTPPLEIFKNYARRRASTEENSDLGLAEVGLFTLCDKDIFPSVHNVLQLLLTVPQTSVTVERLVFCETHKYKSKITDDNRDRDSRLTSFCLIPCENYRSRAYPHTFKNSKNRRLL